MCNLSQGIEEKGIAIGEARKEEKIIPNKLSKWTFAVQIVVKKEKINR